MSELKLGTSTTTTTVCSNGNTVEASVSDNNAAANNNTTDAGVVSPTMTESDDVVVEAQFQKAYVMVVEETEAGGDNVSTTTSSSNNTNATSTSGGGAATEAATCNIWELLFTLFIPMFLEGTVHLFLFVKSVTATKVVPLIVTCLPTWVTTLVTTDESNTALSWWAHYFGLVHDKTSHYHSHNNAWPPPAFVFLAALTIFALIVHPDGYTWIFLRKLRSGAYFLIQSTYACWDIVINDYGMILSTFFAVATFASLFFFAYVLRKTLSPRPNPAKKANNKLLQDQQQQQQQQQQLHHHNENSSNTNKHKKNKRRKGNARGHGHRSGRLRGGVSNHHQQQQQQQLMQQQQQPQRSAASTIEDSSIVIKCDNETTTARSEVLPALLEDRSVSPPPVIAEPNDGEDVRLTTASSSKAQQVVGSSSSSSSDRIRTMSASTEDSTVTSDDLSYESVTGRSTPTMAPPVDKPSVILQAASADPPRSNAGSSNTRSARSNNIYGKGNNNSNKQKNRKQTTRRGKKSVDGDSSWSNRNSGGGGGGRNSSRNLSPPPTPSRWAALKPTSSSSRHDNARQQQRDSNRGQPSSSGRQHLRGGSNHNSNHRRDYGSKSARDNRPSNRQLRTVDSDIVPQQQQVTGSTGPARIPTRAESVNSPVPPMPISPPPTPLGNAANIVPCPPGFGMQAGSQVNNAGGDIPFCSPARTFSSETPFGTPASVASAEQGSFFSSSWNDHPHSPSWADSSNSVGKSGGSNSLANNIRAPPGLARSSFTSNSGSFTAPMQKQHSIESTSSHTTAATAGEPPLLQGLSLPPGASPIFCAAKVPLKGVKDNPFVDDQNHHEDDDQIEAELQELGGQMVGSILDF